MGKDNVKYPCPTCGKSLDDHTDEQKYQCWWEEEWKRIENELK